jgi:PucR family transcriptional regulator, purine catabolism regulatory protein
MLTVRNLVEEMGLELLAGVDAADAPVRWVHISELPDPTPWLSGGEIILTTGLQLTSAKRQRDFARLLGDQHVAGVGFGVGFEHERVPEQLVEEARAIGLPVFEVPYELPFIALTEKAFGRLVNEQYEVLQRGIAIHKRLERLVLEERGLDELVGAVAAAIGGLVMVLDARGETLAERTFRRKLGEGVVETVRARVRDRDAARSPGGDFAPDHPEIAGRALVLPISTRGRGTPRAWLFAARDAGSLGDFERLILQQAATVVALELMRQRVMRDTERRLAGDVLAQALTGRLAESEVESRLRPFGIGEQAAVLVFECDDPAGGEGDLERALAESGLGALVACRERLLCAVVDATRELDPVELARELRTALLEGHGGERVRAAASRSAPVGMVRRSFHEARCALEATALANGAAPDIASHADLGAFRLLLAVQDDEALRVYTDSVLGPLEDGGGEYGDELLRSLEAFIEQNGQWEKAARQLYCHRHTLRYRIRKIEELTGRDMKSARDRIELWLALRARELIA